MLKSNLSRIKEKACENMLQLYLFMIEEPQNKVKFETLYHQYRKLMFYSANQILKDTYLAEDAVHQAFIKIIPYLDKIKDFSCHKTKAFMVIVVESIAKVLYMQRKKGSATNIDDYEFELHEVTENYVLGQISVEQIKEAIKALPAVDREVLVLRYIEDLDDKEITKILNISHAAVRKRMERARKKLAVLLERE